jgi:pimeloyl-ACP methyl ester carboxylesterase
LVAHAGYNPLGMILPHLLRVKGAELTGAPERGFAKINGASLYYEVMGGGEPLVLVHAGIADGRMWDRQLEPFARHYRVVRYDMRGFGRTPMVEGSYSHHEDLDGLLDFLGIEWGRFVGCSMGGKTVLDFTLRHPERARALVPIGPAVSGFEPDIDPPEQWDELVAAYEAGNLDQVSELEVQIWVDGPHRGPDKVDPSVRDLVREMNLIALENEASGLGEERPPEPPAAGRLSEIQAPSLIVVGDRDRPEIVAAAELLAERLPNAQKVVMPETAHLPNMERPEEFNRIVLEFLDGLSA